MKWGWKWAGTNLNRGYGHPKAEGYQATPPARRRTKAAASFKGFDTTRFELFVRCHAASNLGEKRSVPVEATGVEVVVRNRDRVVGVEGFRAE